MKNKIIVLSFALFITAIVHAQTATTWNGKTCAVSLTYDDAIDVDLDHAIPALDSFGLKGTFYLIGSSPSLSRRIAEWRVAAMHGHELANHTSFHPCDGQKPGRTFIRPETDLSRYTIARVVSDIKMTNTLLNAIDGKTERTFAFPCGDTKIGDTSYYDYVQKDFVAARGVHSSMQPIEKVDLSNIDCYGINGQNGDYLINLVKKAMETHTLLVFLFHGVGGGHNINVSMEAHTALLRFLHDHQNEIWIAPMLDVAKFIREHR